MSYLLKKLREIGRDDEDNTKAINILEASGIVVKSNDG